RHPDRRTCPDRADAAALERYSDRVFLGYTHGAQPVSAGAGKRSRRGAPAARRIRPPRQPDRQRYPDGRRETEQLTPSFRGARAASEPGIWRTWREIPGSRLRAPRNDGVIIHISSVTVTGTWSEGRSQPRASRRIRKSLTASFSARDTQM